jgi:hypothetical protein
LKLTGGPDRFFVLCKGATMINQKPKRKVSPLAKVMATLFAFLLTISLILLIPSIALTRTLFNADYYKNIIAKQNIYDQVPQLLIEQMKQNITDYFQIDSANNPITQLNSEQLSQLINPVLPQDYFKTQIENNINSFFDFFNLQTPELKLEIDLQPIKSNLSSEAGQIALMNLINSLPDCSEEQIQKFILAQMQSQQTSVEFPICKPPEMFIKVAQPILFSSLQQFAEAMPNKLSFVNLEQTADLQNLTSSWQFQIYKYIRGIMPLIPWFAITFALLIFLLTLNSVKTMFSSLGMPLVISGIIVGILSILMMYEGNAILGFIQPYGSIFSPIIINVGKEVFRQSSVFILVMSGIALIGGMILVFISKLIRK